MPEQSGSSLSVMLRWQEISIRYHCKRSKALKIIHEVGPVYVGRTPCVAESELEDYVRKHGEIRINW